MNTQIQQVEERESSGVIKIEESLLQRAKSNDFAAIEKMFRQFLPEDEKVLAAEYLGVKGIWGFGTFSFACVTNRRVAAIRTGHFGEVWFQDGCMEYINSGVIYQPSKFRLYVLYIVSVLIVVPTLGFGLLLLPWAVNKYYDWSRCGVVFAIREGVNVYLFTDRGRLRVANRLYRMVMQARELRVRDIGHGNA
jgi:hypothetical protein